MKGPSAISERFAELLDQLTAVEATKQYHSDGYVRGEYVDDNILLNWKVKAKNLLRTACGFDSEHYKQFESCIEHGGYVTNHTVLLRLKAVFLAAQEDYNGGYLISLRTLVQAEVFSTELDQARELLNSGYITPAAVVAGVVLETTLRQLCIDKGIDAKSLARMNDDLVKAGVFNSLTHKRVTALAALRNSAAHGKSADYDATHVKDMIEQIERFVEERLP